MDGKYLSKCFFVIYGYLLLFMDIFCKGLSRFTDISSSVFSQMFLSNVSRNTLSQHSLSNVSHYSHTSSATFFHKCFSLFTDISHNTLSQMFLSIHRHLLQHSLATLSRKYFSITFYKIDGSSPFGRVRRVLLVRS